MTRNTVEQIPGGSESQIESINRIIDYVDSESPLKSELAEWMVEEAFSEMESEDSASRTISFLKTLDILNQHGEQIQVGDKGTEWRVDGSLETYFTILDSGAIGFEALLERLARGDCSTSELHEYLKSNYEDIEWETDTQTVIRLYYLRSCNLVDFNDGTYQITEDGQDIIHGRVDIDGFQPPPSIDELLETIQEIDISFPVYLSVHSTEEFEDRHINPPIDNEAGINPRDIDTSSVFFHCVDGAIQGYSRQTEPGSDNTQDGNSHHRIPVEIYEFDSPVYLHDILGQLVDPDIREEHDRYPFTDTGLREVPLGELGRAAAKTILEQVGYAENYDEAVPEIEFEDLPAEADIDGLHYPGNGVLKEIVSQTTQALSHGQHVILVGPPGTGKSELAKQIAREIVGENRYKMVTATADWSTFDTIGGYQPGGDSGLDFVPGVFLERFQDNDKNPSNEWLIIDELNRANVDKAFGSLFSALVGDSVTTSFKNEDDHEIEILGKAAAGEIAVADHRYCIPETWRLIATMNTHDKMSLYDFSYAFIRRFAFVHVGAPTASDIEKDDIEYYLDCWGITIGADDNQLAPERVEELETFWKRIQAHRRVGPAVIEDIACTLLDDEVDFTRPIKMYIIPQLEDLPRQIQKDAVGALAGAEGEISLNPEEICEFASDYFGIAKSEFEGASG